MCVFGVLTAWTHCLGDLASLVDGWTSHLHRHPGTKSTTSTPRSTHVHPDEFKHPSTKDARSPKQRVQALNTPKIHTTYVLYMAHRYIVSAQTHDHNTSTAHSQVHKYLSHACNNDPLVHHDHMIFICILINIFITHIL